MTDKQLRKIRQQCLAKIAEYQVVFEQPYGGDQSERAHWQDLAVEALGAKEDAETMLRLVEEIDRLRAQLAEALGCLTVLDLMLNEHGLAKTVRRWVKNMRPRRTV